MKLEGPFCPSVIQQDEQQHCGPVLCGVHWDPFSLIPLYSPSPLLPEFAQTDNLRVSIFSRVVEVEARWMEPLSPPPNLHMLFPLRLQNRLWG